MFRSFARRVVEARRADCLVGFLRILVGTAEEVGLFGEVLVAELTLDVLAGHVERLARQVRRVGTHVGDDADGAFAGDVHTFIKLLRGPHGALGAEAQSGAAGLLERAGDERRGGPDAGAFGSRSI